MSLGDNIDRDRCAKCNIRQSEGKLTKVVVTQFCYPKCRLYYFFGPLMLIVEPSTKQCLSYLTRFRYMYVLFDPVLIYIYLV